VADLHAESAVQPAESFLLATGSRALVATGVRRVMRQVNATWTDSFREFADDSRDGAPILVGALPFDHQQPRHLYQPAALRHVDAASIWTPQASSPARRPTSWRADAEPSADEYQRQVADILELLATQDEGSEAIRKVVLARSLTLLANAPIDVARVLRRLAMDGSVTVYAVPLPAVNGAPRVLVGATPELLVDKTGSAVVSEPLAGSALRSADPAADRAIAAALMRSDKDRREHAAVVEWVADRLAPYCRTLRVPSEPSPVSTKFVWHLGTRIVGDLKDDTVPSLSLAEVLHPTPAVCGLPRDAARAAIARFERFDRGFFAGAVGWCDLRGDGRWLMTLRCGEVVGHAARLFAGAGIVAGSDPYAERLETSAKFAALLDALGVSEQGNVVAGDGAP
jgi:isochorismate synthase